MKGSWEDFEHHSECFEHSQNQQFLSQADVRQSAFAPDRNVLRSIPVSTIESTTATSSNAYLSASATAVVTGTSNIPANQFAAVGPTQKPGFRFGSNHVTDSMPGQTAGPSFAPMPRAPTQIQNAHAFNDANPRELITEQPSKWAQTKDLMRRAYVSVIQSNATASENALPPGLQNYTGQNLCFINAVLQALSKVPSFTEGLKSSRSPTRHQLIDQLVRLLDELDGSADSFKPRSLDTTAFRMAASMRSRGLVISPHSNVQRQSQQDAAEFLSWLLAELHTSLNDVPQATTVTNVQSNLGKPLLSIVYPVLS